MKLSVRTFVLACIAATFAVTTHSASAQIYSRNTSQNYPLQSAQNVTVNALIVGYSGASYMLGGQQTFVNEGSQPVYVYCWMSTTYGGTTPLPYGPVSSATIPAASYATLPLNGFYTASATEIYVVCRATNPSGTVLSTAGNITAAYVP
jgi:hypothetical protein